MLEHKDYLSSLNKARRKRNQKLDPRLLILILAAVLAVGIIVFAVKHMKKPVSGRMAVRTPDEQTQMAEPQADPSAAAVESDEDAEWEKQVEEAVGRFASLGLIQVSGYVNIRETPGTDGTILGTIADGGGCEVLGTEGDWTKIQSGGLEGYVSSQYLVTGDEAKTLAENYVKLRAVITMETEGEKLRVRETPDDSTSDNVVGAVSDGESFEVLSHEGGWIQIKDGYISDQFAQVSYALEEGRKLDERTKAINQYENLVMSKVNGYLNVRSSPEIPKDNADANIIGKMTSKAGGEILETLDGWYKVKSGPIVGYISAEHTVTGWEAKDIALQTASLKAVISTDVLNVRTEPNTDAKIWTQIVKDEKYSVIDDPETPEGWIKIDLDSVDEEDGSTSDGAYISTRDNNVEVRYVINEAIKFKPAESGSGGSGSSGSGSRRSQVVNYALQFVGNPYVWGGTSLTKGADCSGFTMKVMQKFGVSLPHYSGSQAKMGRKVTSGNMKPGDLIFYAGSSGRVNHVAMYIGNGQIVHAASRRSGIKISTWNYRSPVAIRSVLD